MNQIGVAILFLCCYTSTHAFVFEDCGSELGKFTDITISTCDNSEEKCGFTRGVDINVSVKFIPNKDISKIEAHVFGVLLDVAVPFPLEKPDVCKDSNSNIKCPLKKDQEVEYKSSFFLEKKTPALSVEIMWEFRNENDEKIICIKFPGKVGFSSRKRRHESPLGTLVRIALTRSDTRYDETESCIGASALTSDEKRFH
ncbi:hypothetical protein HN011_002592 [Eciton burchellii]|nr:hypothetical protein HN011_002592 [Eciton burchellii]